MFDALLRPMVDRMLDPVGQRLAASGVSANKVTFAGFCCGIGAAGAVVLGWSVAAVMLLLLNRLLDGLDGAVARAAGSTDLGGFLDITMDFLVYSAIPFAFALKDPGNALAAAFLIFSFRRHRVELPCLRDHRPEARHFDRDAGEKEFLPSRRLDRGHRDHHFPSDRDGGASAFHPPCVGLWRAVLDYDFHPHCRGVSPVPVGRDMNNRRRT